MKVPFLREKTIEAKTLDVLDRAQKELGWAKGTVPVDIDQIIEFIFDIEIEFLDLIKRRL